MWKKLMIVMSVFAFSFAVSAAPIGTGAADAKPRSFSSGKKSFSQTPKKSQDNVSNSSTTNKSNATTTAGTQQRGFFSGGSFLKGMMIGGLAGILFGTMFGTGFFANMIGLIVNLLALFVLFIVFRAAYDRFKRWRQQNQNRNPNQRGW